MHIVTVAPDLLIRVQMEYLEMPGLCLTSTQARRLWNLDQTVCDAILDTLVRARFLSQTAGGGYLRQSTGSIGRRRVSIDGLPL